MPRTTSSINGSKRQWLQRARYVAVALVTGLTLTIAACGTSTNTGPGGSSTPTTSPTASGTTVKVYFTRHPDSDNDPTKVFVLSRTSAATLTTTQDKATFALEQVFAGPTQAEQAQGYYSPFAGQITATATCPDPTQLFTIALDHRGNTAEQGTATFQFCRLVTIPGDLDGPRMSAMVTSTLLQFSDIKKVVILNYQGRCFDDMQGVNACLAGASTTPAPGGYPVKVFFSKHPDSDNDFTKVFGVNRTAPDLAVATYAVQQLIAGPTAAEQQAGYFTELTGAIDKTDPSSCNGADFTITLNVRGTTPESGTATLRFCRTLHSAGIGMDARINAELQATLTQFPAIKKAVILTKAGNCFGDMSTQNICLQP